MGMRSMNALVVKAGHKPSEDAERFLKDAKLAPREGGTAWVWETKIQPLWARKGDEDLKEEVAILGWLLTLPVSDFQILRCGEELGSLGEHDLHAYQDDPTFARVAQQYGAESAAAVGHTS